MALVLLVLLVTGAPAASAHAYLESSNPADGAALDRAPRQLRLGFSEHVVPSATRITVVDGSGRTVPVTRIRMVSTDPTDTEEPAEIVARLPRLSHGSYRVTWQTLSADDLHRTSGLLVFGVRTHVRAAAAQETPPAPDQSAVEALLLTALALALGAPLARRTLAPVPGAAVLHRRLAALGRCAALLALAAALVVPLVEALGQAGPAVLTTGSYALRWSVREAGLGLLLAHHLLVRRDLLRRLALVAGAGVAAVGHALLGHAAAGARLDVLRVVATAAHLVAALTWAGAVACLAVALTPTLVRPAARMPVPSLRSVLRRFAVPAAACVSVAAVTGVYLASHVVVSLDAVVDTTYGRVLLLKLAVVLPAGLLSLVNHRRLRGPRDLDVPRRTVRGEAVLLLLVLGATAVLVTGQPATQGRLVDVAEPTPGLIARQVGPLAETVKVRPNRPGASVVLVDVFDTRRPAPGQVSGVSVSVGGGAPVAATPLGDRHWSVPVTSLAEGPVPLRVSVTEAGATTVVGAFDWVVGPPGETPPAHLSRAPISSALRQAALALAVLVAGAWLLARRRRLPGRRAAVRQPQVGRAGAEDVDVLGPVR